MRIGVAATPSVAIPTMQWLRDSENIFDVIITRPDQQAGRGRTMQSSPVAQWGEDHEISVKKPASPNDMVETISTLDLVITIGYGVLLPLEVLTIPRYGFINLHFSLLPKWRGAAPVNRAIQNGDSISGVTVFQLDAGMDTGPIYVQKDIAISDEECTGDVLLKMAQLGPSAIEETLQLISTGFTPIAQSDSGISFAPKIRKAEVEIVWSQGADEVHRNIRAFTPEPGSWTSWRDASIIISKASPISHVSNLKPGSIRLVEGDVVVGCGDDSGLRLDEVRPSGKNTMTAQAWARGARIHEGDCFVSTNG
ncbi:MAG: methionyl-tRNA formyltransferase [Streptomycetaceae bacterium]|nr:MAG: methionyl-tRNA formyltransferase [Streptomycetaceae bacterium]